MEDVRAEVLDKKFVDVFSLSAQDLSASEVLAELNIEKVECDMNQGNKVESSADGGRLTRSKYSVIVSAFP